MTNSITLIIRDIEEKTNNVLDIPANFTSAQVLGDLIQSIGLPVNDNQRRPLRYHLQRKKNRQLLPPSSPIGENGLMRGEVLLIYSELPSPVVFDKPSGLVFPELAQEWPEKWAEIQRWQAAGAFDRSIVALLSLWLDLRNHTVERGELRFNHVSAYVTELFARFIFDQLRLPDFDNIFELLQSKEAGLFFTENPAAAQQLARYLLMVSYRLGANQQYLRSHEAAILALQLEPNNAAAIQLEELGRAYVTVQASTDSEEKLQLAESIFEIDSEYGNIRRDLEQIRFGRSHSMPQPGAVPIPETPPWINPAYFYSGSDDNPVFYGKARNNLIQYLSITAGGLLFLILVMVLFLTSR